jgi:hypothetical protein
MRLEEEIRNPSLTLRLTQTVDTPDFGTVTLTTGLYERWNADAKSIVGWPIANSFAPPGGGNAVYCESGMIVDPPSGGPFIVYGRIYVQYRRLDDVHGWVGLPLGDEQAAANGGRLSRFANADIYWSGGSDAHEVHGAIRDRYNSLGGPGGFLGYPLTDETPVMRGGTEVGRFNRFQGGVIYWSPGTGAWEVHGAIRDEWENAYKGATGDLGFPLSNETRTGSDSYRYSNFEHGVITWHSADGSIATFTQMDFFLDGFNSKGDDGFLRGSQDLYVKVAIDASSGENYHARMPSDGDYGADEQITRTLFTIGRVQGETSIHVRMEGWDSDWPDGDDQLGVVDQTYNIENLWGINEDASHWRGDFEARYKIRRIVNFDRSKFRENFYWKFHNFSTPELSWAQYAETFRDVSNDESVVWHPFDHIFYSTVYKGVASSGNCFGMCWESVFAHVGRSIYREPIALVPPTNGSRPASPANSEVINVVNVKHGYQTSGEMVDWFLGKFITGQTHDPKRAFTESRAQFAAGDYPVIALTDKSLSVAGHVVRPYAWDDSHKPWKMYICDPNQPLVSGNDPHDTFIEIDPDANTFRFQHAANDVWTGGEWSGGRMYSIPFHVVCEQPRTPFWEVLALLVGGSLILLGGDAKTQQIRDSSGRTFYKNGLTAPPQNWEDLQNDRDRIPNMARIPKIDDLQAHLRLDSRIDGHIVDMLRLAQAPEVYYMTQARPKPSRLTMLDGIAPTHLADRALIDAHANDSVKPDVADAAISDAAMVATLNLGVLHDFASGASLPAGGLEYQIAQGGGAYTWGVRTPVASHVATIPSGAAAKDSFLVENLGRLRQAVTYSPANDKSIGMAVAGSTSSPTPPRTFGITNMMLRAGQKIRTHFDESTGALVVENPGDATQLDVHISAGPGVPASTTRTAVPIDANSVTRFEPVSWTPADIPATKIKMAKLQAPSGTPISVVEI